MICSIKRHRRLRFQWRLLNRMELTLCRVIGVRSCLSTTSAALVSGPVKRCSFILSPSTQIRLKVTLKRPCICKQKRQVKVGKSQICGTIYLKVLFSTNYRCREVERWKHTGEFRLHYILGKFLCRGHVLGFVVVVVSGAGVDNGTAPGG